jgi:hypothetical protein
LPDPVSVGARRSRSHQPSLFHRVAWRAAAVLPIAVVAIVTVGLAAPSRVGATVSPATKEITIPAGGTAVEQKTVGVPAVPPKADILIAIDTTGSMQPTIAQAQADANAIVTGVQASVLDTQFAVVDFKDDFDGAALEYRVARAMTPDAALVSAAIDGLTAGGGGDAPEAHNLVFRNSYTPDVGGDIGWRAGTKKIVVVITDAEPHGAGTTEQLSGCFDTTADPHGLNTVTELNAMAAADRTLFMIRQDAPFTTTTSLACLQSIAAVTGGTAVNGGEALGVQIVGLINGAFTAATEVHMEVAAAPESASASWISFAPPSRTSVATPSDVTFDVTISVPIGTPAGSYVFDLVALADGADIGHQILTVVVPAPFSTPSLIRAVSTGGTNAFLIGRIDGAASVPLTLAAFTASGCTDGDLAGGGTAAGGPVAVTTDANGYFGVSVTGVTPGHFVAVAVATPSATDRSACIVSSGDNDFWPKALNLVGTSPTALDYIDSEGKARWYKFDITPGQRITISLSDLPADYDLAVFKDIGKEFIEQLTPTNTAELTKLSAEYAPSVFSPSVFSPSVFSPSVFSPDAYSPSVFSPSVFSPSVFSPSVFSPSVFSPSVFSPSVFSPSVFSPSVFSPSVFSPDDIAKAFSSAQTRSVIGVSATPGTGDETVIVNTWNNTGSFYVRVAGHLGAFTTDAQFKVTVAKGATTCAGVTDTTLTTRSASTLTGVRTVILTDSSKIALGTAVPGGGTLGSKLATFAARPEIGGAVVDVASDTRVGQLKAQADDTNNRACPFAKNLLAEEIKGIVDSFRTPGNPGLRYVVIVGDDATIPFFRYPDQSLLGQESGYVPPVDSNSPSEASLRRDFVLSQDAYGAGTQISLRTSDFPVPGLAVGRLVETPSDIAGLLDAYTTTPVVAPSSSLVTGYDFLADAADAVKSELQAGTGVAPDTLITPNGKSPEDIRTATNPNGSWTASQLSSKLLGSRHDVIFLAGHFSANSALAADFSSSMITTDLAPATNLANAIIFSAGCHSGYNLVDGDVVPGVTLPLDWAQAFAQKKATLIAGTGYQYGDTDFLEYSERLYFNFAQQLRRGAAGSAVSVGEALVKAKRDYLGTTPDIRGIHEKAVLEATLFGLPMLGVNMPSGRGDPADVGGIAPVPVTTGPAAELGLETFDLGLSPVLTPHSIDLKNPPYDALPADPTFSTTTARWLSGPDGVVSNPAEPALPLLAVNVTPTPAHSDVVLRGVGFRGGDYKDDSVVPLTGAATTELRGVHAPFVSPVFYPMKLWNPNYFGALDGTGGTNLLVTPAQHRADNVAAGTSVRRKYTKLDLRLFYSGDLSKAALSDAPSIVSVDAQEVGPGVAFTAQVVGDPAAAIHEVWITYTDGDGMWVPLDLAQCVAPLSAACGTIEDSRLWKGTLATSPGPIQYVVQAASGVGLVSFDDNRGSYYEIAGAAQAASTLTLIAPPSSGTFGDSPLITAELKTVGGDPLSEKFVTLAIGGSANVGTTDIDGLVTLAIPLVTSPGQTQITASFGGDASTFPSDDSHSPFTVAKATSSLSPFSSQPVVVTAGGQSGIVTTLTAALGGRTQALLQQTVTFTLSGPGAKVYSTITDYRGRATLPTSGLAAGTYSVAATFAGDSTYTSASRGPGALVVSAFTGFFQPVDNPPTVNTVNAGSAVPIKFSLGANRGLGILAAGSPILTTITCGTTVPLDDIETTAPASSSGLQYDAASNQYTYVWKTTKGWTGCRQVNVRLVDGTDHLALFKFK